MKQIDYFAFGSNMNQARMKERLDWAPPRRAAFLKHYRLRFDKISEDGGKANIRPHVGSIVEGVLYLLGEKDLLLLDRFEGVAEGHYHRNSVEVMSKPGGLCKVVTYIALRTGPEKPPTRAYLNHLLAGKDLLSQEYVKSLERLPTIG